MPATRERHDLASTEYFENYARGGEAPGLLLYAIEQDRGVKQDSSKF
jgi:hypothetical protein